MEELLKLYQSKKEKQNKIIEFIIVGISLIAAFFVYESVNPEKWIKPDSTPVTAKQIAQTLSQSYVTYEGKVAGSDIRRLSGKEEFMEITETEYVTAEPKEIIATGIYSLKPWVDPYKITKIRGSHGRLISSGRKAPEITDNRIQALEYYQEYYLIQLKDETYILAQFSSDSKEKIESGKRAALPIGRKKTNTSMAKQYLEEICNAYGADTAYTLYLIDDKWQEEKEFPFFILKFGSAAAAFFVLAFGLMMLFSNKIKQAASNSSAL